MAVLTYRNNDFFGLVDGLNIAFGIRGKMSGLSKEGDPLVIMPEKVSRTRMAMVSGHQRHMIWAWG